MDRRSLWRAFEPGGDRPDAPAVPPHEEEPARKGGPSHPLKRFNESDVVLARLQRPDMEHERALDPEPGAYSSTRLGLWKRSKVPRQRRREGHGARRRHPELCNHAPANMLRVAE